MMTLLPSITLCVHLQAHRALRIAAELSTRRLGTAAWRVALNAVHMLRPSARPPQAPDDVSIRWQFCQVDRVQDAQSCCCLAFQAYPDSFFSARFDQFSSRPHRALKSARFSQAGLPYNAPARIRSDSSPRSSAFRSH